MTKSWVEVLQALDSDASDRYETAYNKVLEMGDDIYLLRLISQTGPVIKDLNPKTAWKVMKKFNKIIRCNIL